MSSSQDPLQTAGTEPRFCRILGVNFFTGTAAEAVALGLRGGMVSVPSAPVLIELSRSAVHREAVLDSDLAITDSGAMILAWRLLSGERIPRVSGLEYLKRMLREPALRAAGQTFWVMPTRPSMEKNIAWLRGEGFAVDAADCYLAPIYGTGALSDPALRAAMLERRPAHVFLCVGGNVQERLAHYLKQECAAEGYRPGLHCIGAAIGFLSGDQVKIPMWADRFFLGWLFRCLSQPAKFVPRYWQARKLFLLMWKYRARLPIDDA